MIAVALLLAAAEPPSFPMEKMTEICEIEFVALEHDLRVDPPAEAWLKGRAAFEAQQRRSEQRDRERVARRHFFGKSQLGLGLEGLRLLDVLCNRMNLAYLEGARKQLEATPIRVTFDTK